MMAAMRVLAVCVALTMTVAGQASSRWLGVFAPVKGARELCSQHTLGGSAGSRIEIAFTLYATTRPPEEIVRFYATAHKQTVDPGATTLTVKVERGHKVLSVFKAADERPACGVDPHADEPTVVLVSEVTPG